MVKNPADDGTFERLPNLYAEMVYLGRGIETREKKIEGIKKQIERDIEGLIKQGYDMGKLVITIVPGVEL